MTIHVSYTLEVESRLDWLAKFNAMPDKSGMLCDLLPHLVGFLSAEKLADKVKLYKGENYIRTVSKGDFHKILVNDPDKKIQQYINEINETATALMVKDEASGYKVPM